MYKITVLYHHPKDPQQFEEYYKQHLEFAKKIPDLIKFELTKFESSSDLAAPAYYRMAELYFNTREIMSETMSSPQGQTVIDDLLNFATGGVTVLLSTVEKIHNF